MNTRMSDNDISARIAAARAQLEEARAARTRALQSALRASAGPGRTTGEPREEVIALREHFVAEKNARNVLDELVKSWAPDPEQLIDALDGEQPIVLFPVRLETRWDTSPGRTPVLRIRIYPDGLLGDAHEPLLTSAEVTLAQQYWTGAWSAGETVSLWQGLVQQVGAERAAWLVRATTPTNLPARPAAAPVFPELETRADGWVRAPAAQLLPDAWIAQLYRGGAVVHTAHSGAVRRPLTLTASTSGSGADDADLVDLSGDGLTIDPELLWTVDYAEAEAAGMGITVELDAQDEALGFDRLLVFGVRAAQSDSAAEIVSLLEAQHFTRGLAFVPQGTNTNNVSGERSGYPPEDADGALSFAVERTGVTVADGAVAASALGIDAGAFAHVAGADLTEQSRAVAMAAALWPATLGYFIDELLHPVFDDGESDLLRRFYLDRVRARGPAPALRVGDVPYGILPASSLSRWKSPERTLKPIRLDRFGIGGTAEVAEADVAGFLKQIYPIWEAAAEAVPHIFGTGDADSDLMQTLALDASTRVARIRALLGRDAVNNMSGFFGFGDAMQRVLREIAFYAQLSRIGHPEWQPRLAEVLHSENSYLYAGPLVADEVSETEGLEFDYIAWIRTASIADLRDEKLPAETAVPNALLYRMLRHALLREYTRAGNRVLVEREIIPIEHTREIEMVDFVRADDTSTQARMYPKTNVWTRLQQPVHGLTGNKTLAEFLHHGPITTIEQAHVQEFRAFLQELEGLPTAELERLFAETLDLCSHRLDAWITALAGKRLFEQRAANPAGGHIGAFSWLENLRPIVRRPPTDSRYGPVTEQPSNAGYIVAPSMTHGSAAAVLRNAYLTRNDSEETYSLQLTSARVRTASELIDGVRAGQPLGALLGYTFERGLHEEHAPLELDKFIAPLRNLYPLVANKIEDSGEPAESVAAQNVVDGLALRRAYRDSAIPWTSADLAATTAERSAIEEELARLDDAVDAVADMLTAESVYQLVRGTVESAGATLDSMAKGAIPPEPEIARMPRGGTPLTERVLLVLGGDPLATGTWWNPLRTPRAQAEPYLNAWVGYLLSDPTKVKCRTTFDGTASPRDVKLSELLIEPLDVLALARGSEATPLDSELDRRVRDVVRTDADGSFVDIDYAPEGLAAGERTFLEVLEQCHHINALLGTARALAPTDLLEAGVTSAPGADTRDAEASARVLAAMTALSAVVASLGTALTAADTVAGRETMRQALRVASLFGAAAAVPRDTADDAPAVHAELQAQVTSVHAELSARAAAATAATDPAAQMRAVFGADFKFLRRFIPDSGVLTPALAGPAGADAGIVQRWLQQSMRVRAPLAPLRTVALEARAATGATTTAARIAQLPYTPGEAWVGLPFSDEASRHVAGRTSIVMLGPAQPAANAEWVGLFLDQWTELIPYDSEDAAVTFHYDSPGAEAPQAILVAVAPAAEWNTDTLAAVLNETLDLARVRAVDGELLGEVSQLLPATYMAANARGDTVATSFANMRVAETVIQPG